MNGTKTVKTQKQQQLANDLTEEALEIAIKNVALDSEMIKALRLTCKRTKVAATARVKKFTLSLNAKLEQDSEANHRSQAVQRSGLLNNITELFIRFDFMPLDNEIPNHSQDLGRALGLLNLAGEVCSKSLKVLDIGIKSFFPGTETPHACGCTLGNYDWDSLNELIMQESCSMPCLLSGVIARPGCMPVLQNLYCADPTPDDIQSICDSGFLPYLTNLSIIWAAGAQNFNTAPATIAAMRNLFQKATNLKELQLTSGAFDFFHWEQLASLKKLVLGTPRGLHPAQRARVNFAPALARPWKTLESLYIRGALLKAPDVVCIFEAEDAFPALIELTIRASGWYLDALSCIRRPRLKKIHVRCVSDEQALILKLTQLMKEDVQALRGLKEIKIDRRMGDPNSTFIEAFCEFLSCPSMAALEMLTIYGADIGAKGNDLVYHIANRCRKLKELDLRNNNFGRSSVALFVGYGQLGAWPELKKLGILGGELSNEHPISTTSEQSYIPQLDVQTTLRQFWPGLECF